MPDILLKEYEFSSKNFAKTLFFGRLESVDLRSFSIVIIRLQFMKIKSLAISVCTLILFVTIGYGQQKFSFGNVPLQDLKMSYYAEDSTAEAVILYDMGKFDSHNFTFTRHLRVKILQKSGLDWGNWVFEIPGDGFFRVNVSNLENGQVVKSKATPNTIYKEEIVKGFEVYKVFAPNVKVGSVIDIVYEHTGLPFEWRFQERIPTVYSELVLDDSNPLFDFRRDYYGFESIEAVSPTKWVAKNMPAFRIEPFMNTYSNYITKFEIQLTRIGSVSSYVGYSDSWEEIIKNLSTLQNFGGVISGTNFYNAFAKEEKRKNISTLEKIQEAYNYVQQNMKWNQQKRFVASDDIKKNFTENHSGSSAEINLTLIAILNEMDIKTYPVILSTRENGLLFAHNPSINNVNYVIGYVQHDGIKMLLDATAEQIPAGMIPTYCMNGLGLVVNRDTTEWISLHENYKSIKKQFTLMKVDAQGNATAKTDQEWLGVGYLNWSEDQLKNNNDPEIKKNSLQKENPELEIKSYQILKKDIPNAMAKEAIELDLSSEVVDAGDRLILNPILFFDFKKNPFKSEARKYPTDLVCSQEISSTVVVQLSKDLKVGEMPPSIKFSTPDGSASFTYLANPNGSNLQFKVVIKINKHVFTEGEYLELRQFFNEVSKKINAPVELIKN